MATVVLYPEKVAELLKGSDGPVFRHMVVQAEKVRTRAKELVGVSNRTDGDRAPGTLRDSIVKRPAEEDGKVVFYVGSADPIALWHHEGTQPHVIMVRNAKALHWVSGGTDHFAQVVHHPGTRPNRFLVDALAALSE